MAGPHIDLKALIREVPDFPQPGVLFRDITPLLGNAEAYRYVIDELTRLVGAIAPYAVVGIESRGFLFGAPVAYNLGVPFVPVRKARAAPSRATTAFAASTTGGGSKTLLPQPRILTWTATMRTGTALC